MATSPHIVFTKQGAIQSVMKLPSRVIPFEIRENSTLLGWFSSLDWIIDRFRQRTQPRLLDGTVNPLVY